jgi:hypothetical protein
LRVAATPIVHGAVPYGLIAHSSPFSPAAGEQSEEPSGSPGSEPSSPPKSLLPALKTTAIPAACSFFVATLTG